jgi:hypothetical protein
VEGLRRKERGRESESAEGGRWRGDIGVVVWAVWGKEEMSIVTVFWCVCEGERAGNVKDVLRESVDDERSSSGRLLARLALFCNLPPRFFCGARIASCSRCICFSASNSDCQISSGRKGTVCAGASVGNWDIAGDKAGEDNRLCCEVGESGAEEGCWGATYECLRSPCSGDLERSSWCTAREKRRQKFGSWTMVGDRFLFHG